MAYVVGAHRRETGLLQEALELLLVEVDVVERRPGLRGEDEVSVLRVPRPRRLPDGPVLYELLEVAGAVQRQRGGRLVQERHGPPLAGLGRLAHHRAGPGRRPGAPDEELAFAPIF